MQLSDIAIPTEEEKAAWRFFRCPECHFVITGEQYQKLMDDDDTCLECGSEAAFDELI